MARQLFLLPPYHTREDPLILALLRTVSVLVLGYAVAYALIGRHRGQVAALVGGIVGKIGAFAAIAHGYSLGLLSPVAMIVGISVLILACVFISNFPRVLREAGEMAKPPRQR